ncbi:unnamed protein product, partial [Staurois parvus]
LCNPVPVLFWGEQWPPQENCCLNSDIGLLLNVLTVTYCKIFLLKSLKGHGYA